MGLIKIHMNKNIGVVLGVIALVILIGGIYVSTNNKNDTKMEQKVLEDKKMAEEKAMMKKKATEEKNAMMDKGDIVVTSGSYEAYAPEKVALASSAHDVVLFFRASWCPTCRAVDADIKANLSKIPSDLAILDVNYDDSSSLKQKYGVTYQHTFVQVDKDGNLIKKWSGSPTLSALVAEVK